MKIFRILIVVAAVGGSMPLALQTAAAQDDELEGDDLGAADEEGAASDDAASDDASASDDAAAIEDDSMDEEPLEDEGSSRFRWGITALGGPLMGGYKGGAGGLDLRFGMQLNSLLGFYVQPVFLVGAGATASSTGASATGMVLAGAGALVDFTLADLFYVAGGPELLTGGIGSASATNTSSSASGSTGPYFSLAFRTGFAFGSKNPDRRKAFVIGLDTRVVFADKVALLPMISLGYEAF